MADPIVANQPTEDLRRFKRRGFAAIGLHLPKNALNIGSALRAAGAFRAGMMAVTGQRFRAFATDTMAAHRHLPLIWCDDLKDVVPQGCVPIAVELKEGAKPLTTYPHPPSAFYIFGPEDGSLGEAITSWCRDVLYVPAGCLNLAACVNVVLYDRMVKRGEWARTGSASRFRSEAPHA